ncbi:MAG: ABC transporter permease [Pseudomonadota bacterium]
MSLFGARSRRGPWPTQRTGPRAWLRDHRRTARETIGFVSHRLATSLLVWLLVGIALALPAGLYLLQINLSALSDDWEGRPGLSVYFLVTATDSQVATLAEQMQAQTELVAAVEVITRDQALAEFERFGGLKDALALVGENPLPPSLRVVLRQAVAADQLVSLQRLAERAAGVDEALIEKTWLERLNQISQLVRRLGLMLAGLFGLGAVLVTASSVRLAIEARLEEVRVMKLVGASDRQIRRPFLYFGAYYGIGGAIVAAMLLSAVLIYIETPLTQLLASYDQPLKTRGFDLIFLLSMLGSGMVLGILGALLAARARLRKLDIL